MSNNQRSSLENSGAVNQNVQGFNFSLNAQNNVPFFQTTQKEGSLNQNFSNNKHSPSLLISDEKKMKGKIDENNALLETLIQKLGIVGDEMKIKQKNNQKSQNSSHQMALPKSSRFQNIVEKVKLQSNELEQINLMKTNELDEFKQFLSQSINLFTLHEALLKKQILDVKEVFINQMENLKITFAMIENCLQSLKTMIFHDINLNITSTFSKFQNSIASLANFQIEGQKYLEDIDLNKQRIVEEIDINTFNDIINLYKGKINEFNEKLDLMEKTNIQVFEFQIKRDNLQNLYQHHFPNVFKKHIVHYNQFTDQPKITSPEKQILFISEKNSAGRKEYDYAINQKMNATFSDLQFNSFSNNLLSPPLSQKQKEDDGLIKSYFSLKRSADASVNPFDYEMQRSDRQVDISQFSQNYHHEDQEIRSQAEKTRSQSQNFFSHSREHSFGNSGSNKQYRLALTSIRQWDNQKISDSRNNSHSQFQEKSSSLDVDKRQASNVKKIPVSKTQLNQKNNQPTSVYTSLLEKMGQNILLEDQKFHQKNRSISTSNSYQKQSPLRENSNDKENNMNQGNQIFTINEQGTNSSSRGNHIKTFFKPK